MFGYNTNNSKLVYTPVTLDSHKNTVLARVSCLQLPSGDGQHRAVHAGSLRGGAERFPHHSSPVNLHHLTLPRAQPQPPLPHRSAVLSTQHAAQPMVRRAACARVSRACSRRMSRPACFRSPLRSLLCRSDLPSARLLPAFCPPAPGVMSNSCPL